jgi:hypothetical protein
MRRVVQSPEASVLICSSSERTVRLFTKREHTNSLKVLHPVGCGCLALVLRNDPDATSHMSLIAAG